MSETSFDRVISEHLALCERNRRLERRMPLDDYREHESRAAERVSPSRPPQDETEAVVDTGSEHWLDSESFWDTSGERPLPEFDWGDD